MILIAILVLVLVVPGIYLAGFSHGLRVRENQSWRDRRSQKKWVQFQGKWISKRELEDLF